MKTKITKSGNKVDYSKHIKKVIKKIQSGQIPTARELQQALNKSTEKVLNLSIEEKKLFEEFLADNAADFDSNSPIGWSDVDGFIEYYNNGNKYEVDYEGVRPTTIGLKLLEQWYPYKDVDTKKKQVRILRKLQAVSTKIDNLTYEELKALGFGTRKAASKKEFNKLIELAAADKEIDISVSSDVLSSLSIGKGKMTLKTELKLTNAYKGSLSRILRDRVNELFNNYSEEKGKTLEKLTRDINIAKPFRNNVEDTITSLLLKKRFSARRKKAINKSKVKLAGNKAEINRLKNKESKSTLKRPITSEMESLFSIQALINASLASTVKENMGNPGDPAIKLRYQTGRFSESARMLTLTRQESGKLLGSYSYMRYPYDVFLPGGKLNPPVERDPRLYIEESIREIAISVLKDKYPGMDLELV